MHGNLSPRSSDVDHAAGALVLKERSGEAASGVVLVLTASGSCYRFDLAARTVCRIRDTSSGLPSFELRRDEEDIAVLDLGPVEIGHPLVLVLDLRHDGTPTVRTTNEVVALTFADDAERRRGGIGAGGG